MSDFTDMALPATDLTGFDFVDTAIGGVAKRNHVMRTEDFARTLAAHPGIADCFSTYIHFPESFALYVASNPSPTTGRPPSVAGYGGEGLALFLPFDFDGNVQLGTSPEMGLCDV